MSRRALAVIVTLALGAGLAGCGGPEAQRADYCAALTKDQGALAEVFAGSDPSALLDHRALLHDLADRSPEDLADEWQTFLNALDGLHDALQDAHVAAGDFHDGKPPAGLSAADRQRIADAADNLASRGVIDAASGIEQQARDVCKVQLGL